VVVSLGHFDRAKRKRVRAAGRRSRLSRRICVWAIILICVIVGVYFFWPRPKSILAEGGAVVVDSSYSSSPQFTDGATAFLMSKGIHVDVYKDENVTVGLYKQLPAHGYNLIVLRVHAGLLQTDPTAPTFLFTDEPYSAQAWWSEQLEGQVMGGKIDPSNSSEQSLFTVGPAFVAASMQGNFTNSVVILNSCFGLYTDQLADAFVKKGAKVFIGWDEKVSLTRSDEACNLLLKALIDEKMTVSNAVEKVTSEVGEDTTYNSTLEYYPKEAGNLVLGS
jgi:hypothetical protein